MKKKSHAMFMLSLVVGIIFLLLGVLITIAASKGAIILIVLGLILIAYSAFYKKKENEPEPEEREPAFHVVPPYIPPSDRSAENLAKYDYLDFKVAGISYRRDTIIDFLTEPTEEYGMTKKQIEEEYLLDEKIYKYESAELACTFVPDPSNPHDPNAIKVIANGVHVGYVPKDRTSEVRDYLSKDNLDIRACLTGGPYKIVSEDEDSEKLVVETVSDNNFSIAVSIRCPK